MRDDAQLAGSRITLDDGTSAIVKSVSGDLLGVIPDGGNMVVFVARADCTPAEIGQVVDKARGRI